MWEVGVGRVGESKRGKWIQLQVNSNKKTFLKELTSPKYKNDNNKNSSDKL